MEPFLPAPVPVDSPAPAVIRLLVVDDHALFRRGLVALLEQDPRFQVVGQASDASQAQSMAGRLDPAVILLDNHLPGVRGVDAIAGLREAAPGARILMWTVSEDEEDLAAGLRAGADGYLLKTIDTTDLADGICRVLDGDTVISPDMLGKLVGLLRATPAPTAPVAAPSSHYDPRSDTRPDTREIARALNIAETTVKIHVQHILRKLHLSNRVHAAVYATEHGLA